MGRFNFVGVERWGKGILPRSLLESEGSTKDLVVEETPAFPFKKASGQEGRRVHPGLPAVGWCEREASMLRT